MELKNIFNKYKPSRQRLIMPNPWHDIGIGKNIARKFSVVIEIPRNTKTKYELDKKTGYIKLDRILSTSTMYPANYGFIPQTMTEDGDPLDVLVLCQESMFPGIVLEARAIGVVMIRDQNKLDEKIIAVPVHDPNYKEYKDIKDMREHFIREIEHFFSVYKELEHKKVKVERSYGKDHAVKIIKRAAERYRKKFGK